jgi:hypothetical protein
MLLTLGQAAKLAGKSKSTLTRAIRAGRLSAAHRDDSGYQIDPAELCRVYDVRPATPETVARNSGVTHHATPAQPPGESPESVARTAAFEAENRMLRMMLDDVKTDRDHWRDMAESAQRLLTDQRAKPRPTSTSAPRPSAAPSELRSGDVVETSIQSGMGRVGDTLRIFAPRPGISAF